MTLIRARAGIDLHNEAIIKDGMALIQDWASCLPAHVLSLSGKRRFKVGELN